MNEERWIMMSDGTPQMYYVGKTDLTDEQIAAANNVCLTECRAARTVMIPGQKGVRQTDFLTYLSFTNKPIKIQIRPSSWIWIDQDPTMLQNFEQMLESIAAQETIERAERAGLSIARGEVTPDGMRMKLR